jgi:type III secretion inner rod protein HrpB2
MPTHQATRAPTGADMTTPAPSTISPMEMLEKATARTPDMAALSEQFSRLMAKEPPVVEPVFPAGDGGVSPLSNFLQLQEGVMKQTYQDVRQFSVEAPTMNVHEMTARQIELQYQIAMAQVQFNAGVYVAQSGKTGLQTLMKNQ